MCIYVHTCEKFNMALMIGGRQADKGKMQTWAYTRDPETRMAGTKLVHYSCRCFVACASQRPVDPLLWGSVGHLIEMRFIILAHPS